MGRLRATKLKQNPHATALSQLQEELRRVSEKFESHEGEFAEALEQQIRSNKSKSLRRQSRSSPSTCTLLATVRLATKSELVIKLTGGRDA